MYFVTGSCDRNFQITLQGVPLGDTVIFLPKFLGLKKA